MATLTFLDPSGSNLRSDVLSASSRKKLTPTSNNAPWIYCNYPERIGDGNKSWGIAENGYYINRQTVNGPAQIFYSHWNKTGKTLRYRIQLKNNNSSVATVTRSNVGACTGWDGTIAVKNFFASSSKTISVPAKGTAWLIDELVVSNGQPFTGMVRFSTNRSVVVTVIAYESSSKINNATKPFPYRSTEVPSNDNTVYSGLGNGYFLTFNHGTISTSSLPYRFTTNCDANAGLQNNGEMVPIKLVDGNFTASITSSDQELRNLGNWCVQNYHKITLRNTSSSSVTVYGYVGANKKGNAQVINRGGTVKSARLSADTTGKFTWKWCKVVLAAGESFTFDYQQILASYGAAATFHEWSLE